MRVDPPKPRLSTSNLAPTESGPIDVRPASLIRTIEPPPRAILWTSGMVKFVRTPAILTNAADCLGYPVLSSAHISVVVLQYVSFKELITSASQTAYPPTSTTRTSLSSSSSKVRVFANNIAPLALFVGPDEKHRTGYSAAVDALLRVPSFNVMYNLQFPNLCTANENLAMTCLANRRRLALRMLAFSRSRNPSRPIAYEQEIS